MSTLTGGCLCGAIKYECTEEPLGGGHCFCNECRRSSGTASCSHILVKQSAVTFVGTPKTFEKRADSGNLVTRAFCGECGSPVFSTNSANPGMVFLRVSSLDDLERFKPGMIVFASRAPSWAHLDPALVTFPLMAPPPSNPAAK